MAFSHAASAHQALSEGNSESAEEGTEQLLRLFQDLKFQERARARAALRVRARGRRRGASHNHTPMPPGVGALTEADGRCLMMLLDMGRYLVNEIT